MTTPRTPCSLRYPGRQNHRPVITSNGGLAAPTIFVPENSTFVTQVTATDQDNQSLTYQIIAGADFDKFQINATTGQLTFKSAPDFEAPTDGNHDNNYQVQVGAFDGIDFGIQTIM